MNEKFLAVLNPAAGGGRCRRLMGPALARLRASGLSLEVVETEGAGAATRIAREGYARGFRRFLAVGGDGTSYEIVNGLFPEAEGEPPVLDAPVREIPFCAISRTGASRALSRRCSPGAHGRAMCYA